MMNHLPSFVATAAADGDEAGGGRTGLIPGPGRGTRRPTAARAAESPR